MQEQSAVLAPQPENVRQASKAAASGKRTTKQVAAQDPSGSPPATADIKPGRRKKATASKSPAHQAEGVDTAVPEAAPAPASGEASPASGKGRRAAASRSAAMEAPAEDAGEGVKPASPTKRKRGASKEAEPTDPTGVEAQAVKPAAARKRKAAPSKGEQEGTAAAEGEAVKPVKAPRGKKATAAKAVGEEGPEAAAGEASDEEGPAKKSPARSRKKPIASAKEVASPAGKGEEEEGEEEVRPKKKPRAKRAQAPERPLYSMDLRKPTPDGPYAKVLSWNVAGLRGLLKKDPQFLTKLLEREKPDVVCLQEIKCSDAHVQDLESAMGLPEGWHASWLCSSDKAGYSGVATLSRVAPLSVQQGLGPVEHDGEGRALVTEYKGFYLINCYVPNSGEGLKRLDYRVKPGGWDDAVAQLVNKLQKVKPVLLAGDLNCAHEEIDIKNPKTNLRSAGFTQEERDSFGTRYLGPQEAGGCGMHDILREQFPDTVAYTYYSYRFKCREKGIGWRLDYFLASDNLKPRVYDAWLLTDVMGSDHIPLGVTLLNTLEDA